MADLRDEIVESQKVRSDLLKWKLIVASGLGAVGLGFGEHSPEGGMPLLLALVPFACAYVDLQCRHLTMRIRVIGAYQRSTQSARDVNYEVFVHKCRAMEGNRKLNAFELEDLALEWSTGVFSVLVSAIGASAVFFRGRPSWPSGYEGSILLWSGVLGLVIAFLIALRYAQLSNAVDELSRREAGGNAGVTNSEAGQSGSGGLASRPGSLE